MLEWVHETWLPAPTTAFRRNQPDQSTGLGLGRLRKMNPERMHPWF